MRVAEEREIEKEREREREVGSTTEKIKDVSMAAWREKQEHEKERAIVYMFEKCRLTWLKKERQGEGERKTESLLPKQKRVKWVRVAGESERVSERKKRGWFTCLKSDSERG